MSLNISTRARNNAGNAIVGLIDAGTLHSSGYIEIRTTVKPTSPQVPAPGTLLATLAMSNPAFNAFVGGQASANEITSDVVIDETGLAGWFRIYNRDGEAIIDGDVSISGGTGDIQFDNINFIKDGICAIESLIAIMPQ